MPKRLAITISGAVSLGSYEAGVLYEVIRAIGQHNQDQATSEAEKIFIDVLTGASAGGMTATIAAQKLAFEAGALDGAHNNCFYRPWVADVSIEGLLAMHGADSATQSILSSQLVVDISKRYLTQRYQSHVDPVPVAHPAAAEKIQLGLALANLNGIDYGVRVLPDLPNGGKGKFVYTRHQDELVTFVDATAPAVDDIEAFWEPLRNACVSCGAFPFAFRVVDVIRTASEFADKRNLETVIGPSQTFTYTDGGTFQNEPLGLAKNLVDEIDEHLDTENRFYLFVAPSAKSGTANTTFNAGNANYMSEALRIASAVFEQGRFRDWITAEGFNEKIALFNARATGLMNKLLDGTLKAAVLQPASEGLLEALFAGQPAEAMDDARARLKVQFADECAKLDGKFPPAAPAMSVANVFIDSLLTLETAADLGDRDEMVIYGITADDTELASSEVFAFAGFFDRRYRDHDYEVGRKKAQAFLNSPGKLGPIRYTPEPLGLIDPALDGLKLAKMDRAVRESVRDRIRDRAHEIMKEAGIDPFLIGGTVREAIDLALIKPQLNKLLGLS